MARIRSVRRDIDIADAVSIEEFERSLERLSREKEEQEYRQKVLSRSGIRRSMKEELEDVTMLDSILSPYELVRK